MTTPSLTVRSRAGAGPDPAAPGHPDPPRALTDVARRVEARIAEVLTDDAERWAAVDRDLADPLADLRSLVLASGKRLRPAFCFWSFVGLGGDPDDATVLDACAALELLHGFALIHDDVMDGSPFRRGTGSLHRELAERHRDACWHGDSDRFGSGVAVLVGDLAFVHADRLISGAPPLARQVWDELRLELSVGQYLDLLAAARGRATPETAGRIRRYKSAKYTVERPLHLGAALADADADAEVLDLLSAVGLPLGEAFQLRDDLLGVWGDPSVTGKPVGEDLRDGKPTLLAALAREGARGAGAVLLERRFGATDLSEAEVATLQDLFESTGARARVDEIVESLVSQAMTASARLPWTPEAAGALRELAQFVARRDH